MLSGKVRSLDQLEPNDVRRKYPRFSPENFPRNVALVDRLGDVAQKEFRILQATRSRCGAEVQMEVEGG